MAEPQKVLLPENPEDSFQVSLTSQEPGFEIAQTRSGNEENKKLTLFKTKLNSLMRQIQTLTRICQSKNYLDKMGNVFQLLFRSSEEFGKNVIRRNREYVCIEGLQVHFENSSNFLFDTISRFDSLRELLVTAKSDVQQAINEVKWVEGLKDDLLKKEDEFALVGSRGVNEEDFIFGSRDSVRDLSSREMNVYKRMRFLNSFLEEFYVEKMQFLVRFRRLVKEEFERFFFDFQGLWKRTEKTEKKVSIGLVVQREEKEEKDELMNTEFESKQEIHKQIEEVDFTVEVKNKVNVVNQNIIEPQFECNDIEQKQDFLDFSDNINTREEETKTNDLYKQPSPSNEINKNPNSNEELLQLDIFSEQIVPLKVSPETQETNLTANKINIIDEPNPPNDQETEQLITHKEDPVPFNNLYINSKTSFSQSVSEKEISKKNDHDSILQKSIQKFSTNKKNPFAFENTSKAPSPISSKKPSPRSSREPSRHSSKEKQLEVITPPEYTYQNKYYAPSSEEESSYPRKNNFQIYNEEAVQYSYVSESESEYRKSSERSLTSLDDSEHSVKDAEEKGRKSSEVQRESSDVDRTEMLQDHVVDNVQESVADSYTKSTEKSKDLLMSKNIKAIITKKPKQFVTHTQPNKQIPQTPQNDQNTQKINSQNIPAPPVLHCSTENIFDPNLYHVNFDDPKIPNEVSELVKSQSLEPDEIQQLNFKVPEPQPKKNDNFFDLMEEENEYRVKPSPSSQPHLADSKEQKISDFAPVNKIMHFFKSLKTSISVSKERQFKPEDKEFSKSQGIDGKEKRQGTGQRSFDFKGHLKGDYGQLD